MNRKIIRISLWAIGCTAVIILFSFVNSRRTALTCTGAEVNLEGDTSLRFISEDEIIELISEKGAEFENKRIGDIDTRKAELALRAHPAIATANVYISLNGVLKADVTQREPLLRVIDLTGDSYYIDKNGNYMPLSDAYTALVPVATGFIADPWPKYTRNVAELLLQDTIQKAAVVDDLFAIAEAIQADTLLSAQLLQLHVRPDKEIEMIARIGPEVVLLGDKTNLDKKLRNLKLFYSQQQATAAAYSMINLKYNNQIICTKSTQ